MSDTITACAITSEDMIALHELIDELRGQLRLFAETHQTRGAWGASKWLEDAMYDVWGAVGELALSEGRFGDKAEPGYHIQIDPQPAGE